MSSSLVKFSMVLVLGIALALCVSVTALASMAGTVTENGVNVRQGSSTSSRILTQVHKGQKVTITGTVSGFYHVYFPGVDDGYISTQFVQTASTPAASTPAASTPAASAVEGTGKVTGDKVNIRSKPSTDGAVLGKAALGDTFKVTGSQSGWYKVVYKNSEAYIIGEFLQVTDSVKAEAQSTAQPETAQPVVNDTPADVSAQPATESIYAVVIAPSGLNLREAPTQESDAMIALIYGEVVDVVSIDSEWIGVAYENLRGFVSAEYVQIERGVKPVATAEDASPLALEIIEYGKQFLGTPYVYGGNDLVKGVDCSGFVYAVMRKFGIDLYRSSRDMIKNGPIVQKSQLRPGDLVFFDTNGSTNNGNISHVGIYIGNSKFMHSSSSSRSWGVTISSLNDSYYQRTYVAGNRVI